MAVKQILFGKLRAQMDQGQLVPFMALTKTASMEVEGRIRANLVYQSTGRLYWNMQQAYKPVIRVNGLYSGCAITSASADNVEVAAGVIHLAGAAVTVNADATTAIVRGATGKYKFHAICASAAGAITSVAGTDGDAPDLTAYGGNGQRPLVATNLVVLGYVLTAGDTAAIIPTNDIYPGETAIVGYRELPIDGGILLTGDALAANHTGPVARGVYAQFYDLTNSLQTVANIEEATLNYVVPALEKRTVTDSIYPRKFQVGGVDWSLVVKKLREDYYWIKKMMNPKERTFLIEFKEDEDDTVSYKGYAGLSGTMSLTQKAGPANDNLNFEGDGELRLVEA